MAPSVQNERKDGMLGSLGGRGSWEKGERSRVGGEGEKSNSSKLLIFAFLKPLKHFLS